MTSKEVREKIYEESPDVVFDYKDRHCGITPIYENGRQRYEISFGEERKVFYVLDDALSDLLYDGKSVNELVDNNLIELDWY